MENCLNCLPEVILSFLTPQQIDKFISDWNTMIKELLEMEADSYNLEVKRLCEKWENGHRKFKQKQIDARIAAKLNEKRRQAVEMTKKPARKPMTARQYFFLKGKLK